MDPSLLTLQGTHSLSPHFLKHQPIVVISHLLLLDVTNFIIARKVPLPSFNEKEEACVAIHILSSVCFCHILLLGFFLFFCRNMEVYCANFKALQGHWCFRWLFFECSMLQVATLSLVMLHGEQIGNLIVATPSDRWASSWRLNFGAMNMALRLLSSDS
jgi:hypothetical protein